MKYFLFNERHYVREGFKTRAITQIVLILCPFHIYNKSTNNVMALLTKLRHSIPRKPLLSIYKTFLRPHLDHCDVIYEKPHNEKFTDTLESIQYNAAVAITGAIKGTSKEKLYNELGLEYLKDR